MQQKTNENTKERKKMKMKSNKAITLVALIITIIVLLILAGVTLNMVLGENGLINKAQSSVDKYKESAENEQKLLNEIEEYIGTNTVTVQQKTYTVGESVEISGNNFYVIGDDGTNVTLLYKSYIGTATWDNAKSKASSFGSNLGGTGRLMTKAEAEGVAAGYSNIGTSYWLADYAQGRYAWFVYYNGVISTHYTSDDDIIGVRPVVVISKSKL